MFLLDTHAFLWWVADDPKLPRAARRLIEDEANICILSLASAWEMSIKAALGKLILSAPVKDFVADHVRRNRFLLRDISLDAIGRIESLPPHHSDPFDRLLAAECLAMSVPIISGDKVFSKYKVKRVWN
jgi:PIN domain nuclease of toxin-antitoxin system